MMAPAWPGPPAAGHCSLPGGLSVDSDLPPSRYHDHRVRAPPGPGPGQAHGPWHSSLPVPEKTLSNELGPCIP
jgi:hypothetical protein